MSAQNFLDCPQNFNFYLFIYLFIISINCMVNTALQMNAGNHIGNASGVHFFFVALGDYLKTPKSILYFLRHMASYLWASRLVGCLVFHYPLSGLQHHGECVHSPLLCLEAGRKHVTVLYSMLRN